MICLNLLGYTCKNLTTSCQQVVFALLVSSCQHVCNKLLTFLEQLVGTMQTHPDISLTTTAVNQFSSLPSVDTFRVMVLSILTFLVENIMSFKQFRLHAIPCFAVFMPRAFFKIPRHCPSTGLISTSTSLSHL